MTSEMLLHIPITIKPKRLVLLLLFKTGSQFNVAEENLELLSLMSTCQVLGLQVCATMPTLLGKEDQTQGYVYAGQTLY